MRRWRKMTWALIIWSALIVVWMISAGGNDCDSAASQSGCEAGTGIAILLIAFIGFFGFIFLTAIWFMTRPRGRPCPRCGEHVKTGVMACGRCDFDFRTLGQPVVHGS
jgi:hypothetical protein